MVPPPLKLRRAGIFACDGFWKEKNTVNGARAVSTIRCDPCQNTKSLLYYLIEQKAETNFTMKNEGASRFVAARRREQHTHISEQEIAQYWRLIAWPAIVTLMVFFFALRLNPHFEFWRVTLLLVVFFAALTLLVRRVYHTRTPLLLVSGLAALVVGAGIAVLRLVHDFAFYRLLTLLTLPAATVIIGLLVSSVTSWIASRFGTLSLVRLLPHRQPK